MWRMIWRWFLVIYIYHMCVIFSEFDRYAYFFFFPFIIIIFYLYMPRMFKMSLINIGNYTSLPHKVNQRLCSSSRTHMYQYVWIYRFFDLIIIYFIKYNKLFTHTHTHKCIFIFIKHFFIALKYVQKKSTPVISVNSRLLYPPI